MKKFTTIKTLLVGLLALGATSALGAELVETYDFSAWGNSHMGRDTYAVMGTSSAGFQVNSVDMNLLSVKSNKDGETWDLSNRFAVSPNVTFRWGKGKNDVPRLGTENANGTFYISVIGLKKGDRVSFTVGGTISFFSNNATYDVDGTPTAVESGTTTVTNGTIYTITGDGNQRLDLTMTKGWNNITKVIVTREVTCAEPTKTMTGAYNNSRKFTLACASENATIYYSESEKNAGDAGWIEYTGEVTTTATTIWAYASNQDGSSSVVTFETGAGTTLDLAPITYAITNMTSTTGEAYPIYTFYNNNATVLGTPTSTLTATFTPDGGSSSSVSLTDNSYAFTEAGKITVTATADGFGSVNAEVTVSDCYVYNRTYDFAALTTDDMTPLGWTKVEDKTYYTGGTSIPYVEVVGLENWQWRPEQGIFNNNSGGRDVTLLSAKEGETALFYYYGKDVAEAVVTFGNNIKWNMPRYNTLGKIIVYAPTAISTTIPATGFATFACGYNVVIPTGVTAYTAKVNEAGTAVNFTKIEGTAIPANTGVLLEGTPDTNIKFTIVDSAPALENNDFIAGTGKTIEVAENTTYFAMEKGSNPLKFAKVNPATVAIPANKAYLAVAAGAFVPESARLTVTFDGEATGIKTVENAKAGKAIYNLNGQRVNKAQKGLYIVNGKKTIIK